MSYRSTELLSTVNVLMTSDTDKRDAIGVRNGECVCVGVRYVGG